MRTSLIGTWGYVAALGFALQACGGGDNSRQVVATDAGSGGGSGAGGGGGASGRGGAGGGGGASGGSGAGGQGGNAGDAGTGSCDPSPCQAEVDALLARLGSTSSGSSVLPTCCISDTQCGVSTSLASQVFTAIPAGCMDLTKVGDGGLLGGPVSFTDAGPAVDLDGSCSGIVIASALGPIKLPGCCRSNGECGGSTHLLPELAGVPVECASNAEVSDFITGAGFGSSLTVPADPHQKCGAGTVDAGPDASPGVDAGSGGSGGVDSGTGSGGALGSGGAGGSGGADGGGDLGNGGTVGNGGAVGSGGTVGNGGAVGNGGSGGATGIPISGGCRSCTTEFCITPRGNCLNDTLCTTCLDDKHHVGCDQNTAFLAYGSCACAVSACASSCANDCPFAVLP